MVGFIFEKSEHGVVVTVDINQTSKVSLLFEKSIHKRGARVEEKSLFPDKDTRPLFVAF